MIYDVSQFCVFGAFVPRVPVLLAVLMRVWRQRGAWFPYFDDAHTVLFLTPISCFDELLAEDRRVNRLEDSLLLWKGIVQSKLLAKCIIVCASLSLVSLCACHPYILRMLGCAALQCS